MSTQEQEHQSCAAIHPAICAADADGKHGSQATGAFLTLIVVAVCVAFALGCAHREAGPLIPRIETMSPADRAPTKHCTFVLRTALPSAPETIAVYRVRPFVPKKPILLKLIKALPIEATPEVARTIQKIEEISEPISGREDPAMSVSVGGWTIHVLRGGAYSCWRDDTARVSAREVVAGRKIEPPSAESVRKVADSFLARAGLMPEGLRFSGVGATEWIDHTAVGWAAAYRRDIDGIRVAAGVSVEVGPDLKLLYVRNSFREVIPDRIVPILSAQEAFDLLCKGEGYFDATTVAMGKRYVESVRLTYWQGSFAVEPDYLVPIYVFDTDTGREPCPAFVEAIRPEYLQKPRARPQ